MYTLDMLRIKYSDNLYHFYRSLLVGTFDIKGSVNEFGFFEVKIEPRSYLKILKYLRE